MATTHIIGAGIAGLAAATSLARAGHHVQIYESAATPGGRIRHYFEAGDNIGYEGTHALLFNAYTTLKDFARSIGSEHTFFTHSMAGEIYDMQHKTAIKRRAFLLPPPSSATEYMQWLACIVSRSSTPIERKFDYFHPLSEAYIEPLCKTLMFQHVHQSETRILARKLRYMLRKGLKGLRLLAAKESLYHSLITPAIAQIEQEGGGIYYNHRLQKIEWLDGRAHSLHFDKQRKTIGVRDHVILALPYSSVRGLALPIDLAQPLNADIINVAYTLDNFTENTLTTMAMPIIGGSIDWLKCERGRIITISYAPYRLMSLDNDAIARRIWLEIAPLLKMPPSPIPKARVFRERKAIAHSIAKTPPFIANVCLAGDYSAAEHYPPIEAAIISGQDAAKSIITNIS